LALAAASCTFSSSAYSPAIDWWSPYKQIDAHRCLASQSLVNLQRQFRSGKGLRLFGRRAERGCLRNADASGRLTTNTLHVRVSARSILERCAWYTRQT